MFSEDALGLAGVAMGRINLWQWRHLYGTQLGRVEGQLLGTVLESQRTPSGTNSVRQCPYERKRI
jgi:hypothetical protein